MKPPCKIIRGLIPLLFIPLSMACSDISRPEISTLEDSYPPAGSQDCQTTPQKEWGSSLLSSSLLFSTPGVELSWIGPDGLFKIVWELADGAGFTGPVEITGKRVGGPERAEFLFYDGEWVRRINLLLPVGASWGGYVIFPTQGCWEFQAESDGELLAKVTRFISSEGVEVTRLRPPAASVHGKPLSITEPKFLKADCPLGQNGIQVSAKHEIAITIDEHDDDPMSLASVNWEGPDKYSR